MKLKSFLLISILAVLVLSTLVSAYEKAEIVDGDLIIMQKLSSGARPFAIELGKANFRPSEPMNIKVYIDVPCDRNVVQASSSLKLVKGAYPYTANWNWKLAVPASCFTWYIKHSTTAPVYDGDYSYSYAAIDSRTGGTAVQENKLFSVASGAKACPVDSCTEWANAYGIDNGLVYTRSCTTYSPVEGCPSKVTGQSQLVCNEGYYKSGNSCISDQADSDGDGIVDSDESAGNEGSGGPDSNPVESFFESIGLIKPAPEGTPIQDKLNLSGILILGLVITGIYLWRKR